MNCSSGIAKNRTDWQELARELATIMVWRDSGNGPHESAREFWVVWDAALAKAKAAGLLEVHDA